MATKDCTICPEHLADISELVATKLKLEAEVSKLRAECERQRPVVKAALAYVADWESDKAQGALWLAVSDLEDKLYEISQREKASACAQEAA